MSHFITSLTMKRNSILCEKFSEIMKKEVELTSFTVTIVPNFFEGGVHIIINFLMISRI